MFNKIQNLSQKKLKLYHILTIIVYGLLAFVGPVVGSIILTANSGKIEEKWKAPILVVVIIVIILLSALFFLKKHIKKIKVKNIDGTYNTGMFWTKLIMSFICAAIVPLVLLFASFAIKNWLMAQINFYMDLLILNLSFVVVSKIVNEIFLQALETELEIRDEVANQNAVQLRVNNLSNINK